MNDVPSLFSMLPEPFTRETNIPVNTVEALQKMEEDLKSAKILAFAILEDGSISVSKNEKEFYELSQDFMLYGDWLKEIFENETELVFYNAKAIFRILDNSTDGKKLPKGKFWDALLAQWLLRAGHHGTSPENAAILFAKWNNIKEELKKKNLFELFENKEMPLLRVLYKMEREGIAIDKIALANLDSELQKKVAELEIQIFEIAEEHFNLASPKQLAQILKEKLKLPVLKKSVRGPSTDAETLEMLLEQNEPHPILEPIMNWREFQKLQKTYTEALPKLLSPKTNRLHTTFLPWGTVTGRLSSVNPNLQNIPVRKEEGRRIRAAFVPSQKDWKIISVDYSQIELRMLAHLSGDPELSNAFLQGSDVHSITASKIFGISEVSKEMRAAAKIVNFGVIYGMSAFRLAKDLRISRSKAVEFINGYFDLYGKVKTYFEGVVKDAKENGFIETIAKRRRYLPELQASDRQERAMAERMAMNSPIQGSAADLIMEAMLRLHTKIERENLPLKMLLQVHDELVFECPKESTDEFSRIIKYEMENAIPLSVPIVANAGIGDNWLEAH
jgi:DNA polymerase-1